ncbi:MAG: hypothetical protein KDC34_13515 [Saprospiraceae bacterium]|nr:hypothetical protein [Saprospiraceae bacterium]
MAVNKKWTLGVGKYYFNVNSGFQQIIISRNTREEAAHQFFNYKKVGKQCEWLGQWNGKKFEDESAPSRD